MLYFILGIITGAILSVASALLQGWCKRLALFNKPTPLKQDIKPNEEEYKEFIEADQKASQDFLSAIANLNNFMTGKDYEEDIKNVGQQE